jgi:hypothetical protein
MLFGIDSIACHPIRIRQVLSIPDLFQYNMSLKGYNIFDSGLYRNRDAEWLFPQEKAALHDLQT